MAISEFRLLPSYSKEVPLPAPIPASQSLLRLGDPTSDRADLEYTRYVLTDIIDPIVKNTADSKDAQLDAYLDQAGLKVRQFKDLLVKFISSLRKNDYIPNYEAIVTWVNWGVKRDERYNDYKGLCYMAPKMWDENQLLDFLPLVPKIRRGLTDRQRYIFDNILKGEKLAKGIL